MFGCLQLQQYLLLKCSRTFWLACHEKMWLNRASWWGDCCWASRRFNLTYHQAFHASVFLGHWIFELSLLSGLPGEGGQPKTKSMRALVLKQSLLYMAYMTSEKNFHFSYAVFTINTLFCCHFSCWLLQDGGHAHCQRVCPRRGSCIFRLWCGGRPCLTTGRIQTDSKM